MAAPPPSATPIAEDGRINKSTETKQLDKPEGCMGKRHVEAVLLFLGLSVAFLLRVNMSVAIVAMSNSTTANPDIVDYGWDTSTQSWILSSFFWGYVTIQIPLNYISHTWSATKLLSMCTFICGVVNMLIPFAAEEGGWIGVCGCRIIMGICQASVYPTMYTILGRWAPAEERSRLGTRTFAGAQFGTVVGLAISGFLAASSAGWPSVFYLVGVIAIIWSIAFYVWSADSPALHRSITSREREYIEWSLGQVDMRKKPPTPWKAILTSVPVWALVIVHCGQNWGYWTLLTEMPSYMSAILHFDISKNGVVSALPYLTMWLLSFPFSWFSDYVLIKGWVSRAVSRKVANCFGHWVPAVAMIGLGYASADNTVVAVAILVLAVGMNAAALCGFQINHMDLSPNFAGSMMALSNATSNVMSIVAPLVCGLIVVDSSDVTLWRTVFFISGGIYILCNLIWVLFGEAELQPWNEPEVEFDAEFANPNTKVSSNGTKKKEGAKVPRQTIEEGAGSFRQIQQ